MSPWLLGTAGGAVAAAGLWVLLALRWSRPRLVDLLADPLPPAPVPSRARRAGWAARLGAHGAPALAALGLPTARTRRSLAICERDTVAYLAEKTTAGLLGLGVPPVLGAALLAAGVDIFSLAGLPAWALFAAVAWLAPDLALRDEAERRREQMRHTVAAFADLVVVALAGGAGVTGALTDATRPHTGPAMATIRTALRGAAVRRQPPWEALRALGERYHLGELAELAASLQLAGTDGARVRASLAAKATSLRTQHLAALDAQAQSATERMSLPVVLLFAGFLVLIGYPALDLILTTL
ncbi:type II secretion system F family protein [Streptomonospora sp. S1-112]|uniref:Type II secretion system F family protein n=1 Tax=Streptomonospora mangrovi TaxID=2883123 RepID=A0A9X3NVT4_9ACTN|nr:type II secretion system F family protein [Streptomonospora mangrovi]MDA0565176.1 type II secretion system F family protein [Streptomonospora mangrovi]